MSWNYRIVYHKAEFIENIPDLTWDEYLAIHEVYYDDKGKIEFISREPDGIVGEDSLSSIKDILEKMTEALQKPIINYDNLKEIDKEKQNDISKSIKIKE